MDQAVVQDPVLQRLRAALEDFYGPRLDRVVLYGSRARGDAHADSDYDIAVFLHGPASRWDELGRLAEISFPIIADLGELIEALPFDAGRYNDETPFMRNLRRDGVEF